MSATQLRSNKPAVHLVLTVMGMAGSAGLFLPFVYDVSPATALSQGDLRLMALPFFLAPLALAESLRWIISGSSSRLERAMAYLLSTAMAGSTLLLCAVPENWPSGVQDWLSFGAPLATLFLGICFLIRNSKISTSREFNPVLAMHTAYLANALLCLIGFFGDWQVGAYFVLITASVFVIQIILVSVRPAQFGSKAHA